MYQIPIYWHLNPTQKRPFVHFKHSRVKCVMGHRSHFDYGFSKPFKTVVLALFYKLPKIKIFPKPKHLQKCTQIVIFDIISLRNLENSVIWFCLFKYQITLQKLKKPNLKLQGFRFDFQITYKSENYSRFKKYWCLKKPKYTLFLYTKSL